MSSSAIAAREFERREHARDKQLQQCDALS